MAANDTGSMPVYVWCAPVVGLEFDERLLELRLNGQVQDCERAPLRLLRVLLAHAGELVSHDELLHRVWGRSRELISRTALSNAVRKLRQALGDERHELIVSHAGRGYSLQAQVTRKEVGPLPALQEMLAVDRPVPNRPEWVLKRRLDGGSANPVWCCEHRTTHEQHVFKFASDGFRLAALRREVTISRLLREALGKRGQFLPIHEWNLDQAPFFIECEFGGLDLPHWVEASGGFGAISLSRRIAVVAEVAEALALVHSVGVLHKDVKPSNVLVSENADGRLRVRLVDFGSGRLVDPEILDLHDIPRDSLLPQVSSLDESLGTLKYLAPELYDQDAVETTGADIYALGVVLYQLVVGDFGRPVTPGWENDVADVLLRDDIARACAGNPELRLSSAADLAQRLRNLGSRRREHERVLAEREAAAVAQEAVKRARLRRPWVITASVVLIAGVISSSVLYWRQLQATREMRAAYRSEQAVTDFLSHDLVGLADITRGGDPNLSLRDAVMRSGKMAQARFSRYPRTHAALLDAIGRMQSGLGNDDAAIKQIRQALTLLGQSERSTPNTRLGYELDLAHALSASHHKQAMAWIDRALHGLNSQPNVDFKLLAKAYFIRADLDERYAHRKKALDEFKKGMAYAKRAPKFNAQSLAVAEYNYANILAHYGRVEESRDVLLKLQGRVKSLGWENGFFDFMISESIGASYFLKSQYSKAMPYERRAYQGLKKLLGKDNEHVLVAEENLANAEQGAQKWSDAARHTADVVADFRKLRGKDAIYTLLSTVNYEELRVRLGHDREGAKVLGDLVRKIGRLLGKNNPYTLMTRFDLADAELGVGDADAAAAALSGITAQDLNTGTPSEEWPGQLAFEKARLAWLRGDRARAEKLFESSVTELSRYEPPDFWMIVDAKQKLAEIHGPAVTAGTTGNTPLSAMTTEEGKFQ